MSSAGVRAVGGASMHTDSRRQLASWRLDTAAADGFVARQLQPAMGASAHLVLGVSPWHRSAVVERAPEALATTFGLREFARLVTFVDADALPPDPVARAHALIDEVRLVRGLAPPAEPDGDRVPDPMGRSPDAHRHAAELIEDAMQSILDVIAPPLRVARGTWPGAVVQRGHPISIAAAAYADCYRSEVDPTNRSPAPAVGRGGFQKSHNRASRHLSVYISDGQPEWASPDPACDYAMLLVSVNHGSRRLQVSRHQRGMCYCPPRASRYGRGRGRTAPSSRHEEFAHGCRSRRHRFLQSRDTREGWPVTIQDYLRVLRERWLVVLLAVLLGLGGAAAAFFLRPAEYTAKLTILICRYQQTTRAQLATAVSSLQNVSAALLGTVFTMVPAAGPRAYAQYTRLQAPTRNGDSTHRY